VLRVRVLGVLKVLRVLKVLKVLKVPGVLERSGFGCVCTQAPKHLKHSSTPSTPSTLSILSTQPPVIAFGV
jgi:hypothetical protein